MKEMQIEYLCQKKKKKSSKEEPGYLFRPEVAQNMVG